MAALVGRTAPYSYVACPQLARKSPQNVRKPPTVTSGCQRGLRRSEGKRDQTHAYRPPRMTEPGLQANSRGDYPGSHLCRLAGHSVEYMRHVRLGSPGVHDRDPRHGLAVVRRRQHEREVRREEPV